jgi:hypothetical protein
MLFYKDKMLKSKRKREKKREKGETNKKYK